MSLVRNTLVQSGMMLVSRVLGLVRDLALSAVLGAGPMADALYAAQRFPNLFRRFFAEGAFAQAFVPLYARALAEGDGGEARADRIASEAFAFMTAVTIALVIAAQVAMPWIYLALFAGYRDEPATFDYAVILAQITMPYLVFMMMGALFAGMLNGKGRFALAAFAPSLMNMTLIAAVAPFFFTAEPLAPENQRNAAAAAAWAITAAGVLQAGLLWIGCRRAGVGLSLHAPRLTGDVRQLIALALPGAIAGSGTQINIAISQALASMEKGAITYLYSADRLYQLPLGLIGVTVGLALLPRLAKAAVAGDGAQEQAALDQAVSLAMAFTLPAAAALTVMPEFLMRGFWERGAFTGEDARMTAMALLHFGWGVPAFVLIKVFAPAFFARQDTVRPMRFALVGVGINIVLGAGLFFLFRAGGQPGFVALPIATSIAAWVNVALLVGALRGEGRYRLGAAAAGRLARILAATAVMAAAVAVAAAHRETVIAWCFGIKEIAVSLTAAAGFAIYAVAAIALRAVTLGELRGAFRREAGPRLPEAADG